MTKPLDLDAPLTTRDGREVRIYARDGGPGYPVHGAWRTEDGGWIQGSWTERGTALSTGRECGADLINTPVKREGWVNLEEPYPGLGIVALTSPVYKTEAEAHLYKNDRRIACIHVTFTEGDGL